jgi:hypothetical protein
MFLNIELNNICLDSTSSVTKVTSSPCPAVAKALAGRQEKREHRDIAINKQSLKVTNKSSLRTLAHS